MPGASNVRAADSARGQFCGACHDGETRSAEGRTILAACTVPGDPARLVAAQAVQDATTAHFVAANRPVGSRTST